MVSGTIITLPDGGWICGNCNARQTHQAKIQTQAEVAGTDPSLVVVRCPDCSEATRVNCQTCESFGSVRVPKHRIPLLPPARARILSES
jgi:hypothetical protein